MRAGRPRSQECFLPPPLPSPLPPGERGFKKEAVNTLSKCDTTDEAKTSRRDFEPLPSPLEGEGQSLPRT